ncbi:hypothetical protein B0A48_17809 [Cryoendolithus antarcticus]|uniref:SMODS and SLOG-associating 2TM effector domain-containing protein n=1 Tax=Cryoendolithus antarcticus TaxID=1507870 RepID=A0A1V8SB47_9PEZI|nr:hypothetical protein B0A48_17809 [Cryoendolithus antarcticus]
MSFPWPDSNTSERTPLLKSSSPAEALGDQHTQFCHLVGARPLNAPPGSKKHTPDPQSLYARALNHRRHQSRTYLFTATITNGMLLSQVVLGAALTGLGASDSSRVLITVFGALNTVIAGLIAFLKARGQPVRARMFRDDLDRVVDEIENSAVMWLGISRGVHGYDAIDTDDAVTVRSEVARLTRLYDRAVKTNTMNDPDMYAAGQFGGDGKQTGLRGKVAPTAAAEAAPAAAPIVVDESPASKVADVVAPEPVVAAPVKSDEAPKSDEASKPAEETKSADPAKAADTTASTATPDKSAATPTSSSTAPPADPAPPLKPADPPAPPAPAAPPADPDESPATSARPPIRPRTESEMNRESKEKEAKQEPAKIPEESEDGAKVPGSPGTGGATPKDSMDLKGAKGA